MGKGAEEAARNFSLLLVFSFCELCVTFASSAFKNAPEFSRQYDNQR